MTRRPASRVAALLLVGLVLAGCSEGPDGPTEPEAGAVVDACALLSPEALSEALGFAGATPVTEVRNPHESEGSMCSWQLPPEVRRALGTQDFADLSIEVGPYRTDGECWGGDCSTPGGYLAAWQEERDAHARRPTTVLDLPVPAGVVVHDDAEGVLIPEPGTDVVAHLWRCQETETCADAMASLLTAIARAWR